MPCVQVVREREEHKSGGSLGAGVLEYVFECVETHAAPTQETTRLHGPRGVEADEDTQG